MTCKDLIMSIVDSPDQKGYDMSVDDARKLIAIAYYMGRESAARDVSDAYNAVLAAQIQRASGCRYRNMAMTMQGNVKYVYSSDYSGDMTSIFGADITYLTHDNLSNCTIDNPTIK